MGNPCKGCQMCKECKGCVSYIPQEKRSCSAGLYPHVSEIEHCPCLTCLVKGMCNRVCGNFIEYAKKVRWKGKLC